MPQFLDEDIVPFLPEGEFGGAPLDEDLGEQEATGTPVNGSDPDANNGTQFDPEPNPMSSLYQPTYYFKLYVMNDLKPSEDNQVIIAETGNTALNLTSVRIDGIVGPNLRTRNSMATNITIKMTEPFGLNLPDRLVAAARHLNIQNYLKTTFMLQLKLHGYNASGQYVEVGGGWRWRIMIIDVKSVVTEQGAEHTLTAIPYPELALQDQNGILPVNVTAEGTTVGEILKGVIDALNAHCNEIHGYDYITYSIIDSPYPEGTSLSGITRPFDHKVESETPQEENERSKGNNDTPKGQFSQGTDIPSLVDNVFAASKTAVQMATLERSIARQLDQDVEITRSPTSVMHRIETQVKVKGFDPIYGDYQKEIIFVVRPYETMRIQSGLTSASQSEAKDGATRLQHAMKRMFLCKQYDYIFTGLNTEVDKFDIELNFRWAVSAPLLYQGGGVGGAIPNYDNTTIPRYINQDSRELTPQTINEDINAVRSRRQVVQDTMASIADPTDEQQAQAQAAYAELDRRERSLLADRALLGRIRAANVRVGEVDETPEVILAEDLEPELSAVHPLSITRPANNPSLQSGVGMTNTRDGTKSVYGTLLNQLYGSFDGNLQTITLDIKGDPYWLGPNSTPDANFDMISSDALATQDITSNIDAPNFLNGEHMFAFNFGLPQGYDSSTNNVQLNNDETYSGFYAVSKVENIFENGKFQQRLEAYRIPGIALNDLNQSSTDEESQEPGDAELNQSSTTDNSSADTSEDDI